jgi:hypothetical protein
LNNISNVQWLALYISEVLKTIRVFVSMQKMETYLLVDKSECFRIAKFQIMMDLMGSVIKSSSLDFLYPI